MVCKSDINDVSKDVTLAGPLLLVPESTCPDGPLGYSEGRGSQNTLVPAASNSRAIKCGSLR